MILFDDEYTGPRWTYGLGHRPLSTFTVPTDWIVFSNRKHPDFQSFGTVDYPRELTAHEVYQYELTPVPITVTES